jgi:hypothetical protein
MRPEKDEKKVLSLIGKGGGVKKSEKEKVFMQLRLPMSLFERIESDRFARIVTPSRHAWILEAILEKLGEG